MFTDPSGLLCQANSAKDCSCYIGWPATLCQSIPGFPACPSPDPQESQPGVLDEEDIRITQQDVLKKGEMIDYLRQEANDDPALAMVRVAMGESPEHAIFIMWLLKMYMEIGWSNSSNWNTSWGLSYNGPTSIAAEMLNSSRFESVQNALSVHDPASDEVGYEGSNLQRMLYPKSDDDITRFQELYNPAQEILNANLSDMPTKFQGYDYILSATVERLAKFDDPDVVLAPRFPSGQLDRIFDEENVQIIGYDYNPIDNYHLGMVSKHELCAEASDYPMGPGANGTVYLESYIKGCGVD